MAAAAGKPEEFVDRQIRKRNAEIYITLLRTFGIIAIAVPSALLFVNEFTFDFPVVGMLSMGVILLLVSFIWESRYRKEDSGMQ